MLIGVLQLFSGPLLMESPKYLVSKSRIEEAVQVLKRLRGYDERAAQEEVVEIQESASKVESPSLMQLLRDRSMRRPLIISIALMYTQQLSGINAVFYYSTSFFTSAGVQDSNMGTCLVGAINVVATAVAVYLMERAGRRKLLLWGVIGMLFSAVLLTVCLVAKGKLHDGSSAIKPLSTLSIVFVMLFVTFFELGPGPIPWSVGGEIFPEAPRATAMSFCAAHNWFANTLVALFFPSIKSGLGNYSFVPFAVVLALALVFIYKFVPETKGRTIEEIQELMAQGSVEDPVHAKLLSNY